MAVASASEQALVCDPETTIRRWRRWNADENRHPSAFYLRHLRISLLEDRASGSKLASACVRREGGRHC